MLKTSLTIALKALAKTRLRTVLTVLGVIIGITAVIMVMSTGQAIKDLILGEIEAFGSNYIEIEIKTPQTEQVSTENVFSLVGGTMVTTLTVEDAEAVAKHPNIKQYYAGMMGQEIVSYQNEIKKVFVFGTTEAFIEIDKSEVASGRFYTKEEDDSLAKVAVLGSKVQEKLFGQVDPIGKSIKIGRENFRIIGVMQERGATFGFDMDNMVFLPVKTLQKKIMGIDYISFIFAQVDDPEYSAQTAEDIRWIMRDRHNTTDLKDDDFAVTTQEEALEMMDIVFVGIQALLIVLASISLIVGGIGIMNIMYVSVTERTYEIGLRKSVGARRSDIMVQFLAEAVLVTLVGAFIGFLLGVLLSWAVAAVATQQGLDWTFSVSLSGVFLALAMSTITGLIFGLYPARKAAKLEPIDALRKK
jgi:putative ABC transport system permease protein